MEYASRLAIEPSLDALSTLAQMIVAGSSEAARARGVAQVEAAGARLGAVVPVDEALERIGQQARASLVWLELDRDEGDVLDALLDRVDRDAGAGEYAAVVVATPQLVDVLSARLTSGQVQLLVDEGEVGDVSRAAALALALAAPRGSAMLSDIASDGSAARLRQLTDEVGRIAATLARLSAGPSVGSGGIMGLKAQDAPVPDHAPAPAITQEKTANDHPRPPTAQPVL